MGHRRRGRPTGAILVAVTLLGCAAGPGAGSGERGSDWGPVSRPNADQERQLALAAEARDALFGDLMAALSAELAAGSPASAIAVCREQAPLIAGDTAERYGVRIGRTSWKLRNPTNVAPSWAAALLDERPEEPRTFASAEGHLGVTYPIRIQARCLACHGAPEAIPDDVREALARLYPDDRATGFAEGDLRGWLWVEVPPGP